MDLQRAREKLFQTTHPVIPLLLAAGLLGLLYGTNHWLEQEVGLENQELGSITKTNEQIALARDHYASLKDLKDRDVEQFKTGFSGVAKSNKTLFESGLSLQEERRLLEKQLEIMTTYLIVNPSLQRVFLMRGEQPMQSYLINYIPLRSFPSVEALAAATTTQTTVPVGWPNTPIHLPASVRIISKERFAHPERGKSEEVNGRLQYLPPQVGTSVRSNALGEFVMFTNSGLIIHGPPVNPEDHEKFPHICLGLDLEAARKLYRGSFIGTKVILNSVSVKRE